MEETIVSELKDLPEDKSLDLFPIMNQLAFNVVAKSLFHLSISDENYISKNIGFVEQSIFINFTKKENIATCQMSSAIGMAHADVFSSIKHTIKPVKDFDYFLNSVAKITMPLGVFCYSNPNLLTERNVGIHFKQKVSFTNLFKFVNGLYLKNINALIIAIKE